MKSLIIFCVLLFSVALFAQDENNVFFSADPLPVWTPPLDAKFSNNMAVGFDPKTNKEIPYEIDDWQFSLDSKTCSGYIPDEFITSDEPDMDNFGNLTLVSNPTPYPSRVNVKLFITFPTKQVVGSGVLVGSKVVLTAGHCVYDFPTHKWATSIKVVPAYNNGSMPYGYVMAYSYQFQTWTAWTQNQDYNWDIGSIKLTTSLGNQTGWYGYGYNNNNSFFSSNTFHNYSYPAAYPYNGNRMYYRYGTFDIVYNHILYYKKTSYGGQSGSGMYYRNSSNNRYVYGVLSHGTTINNVTCTGNTRINQQKFNWIYGLNASENLEFKSVGLENVNCLVFPNPTSDYITIQLENNNLPHEISIYNTLGERIIQTEMNSNDQSIQIPVNNLKNGYYFITITGGNQIVNRSFVKVN